MARLSAAAIGGILRSVAFSGTDKAVLEYETETSHWPEDLRDAINYSATRVADRAVQDERKGLGRRGARDLAASEATELAETYLRERSGRATTEDRERADRILGHSPSAAWSASDSGDRRRAARARQAVDDALGGESVPWRV